MHKMTQANLEAAFSGESQAHMKYLIFAARAEAEGLPNVARLFKAISYAEQIHATNHFKALGELGLTPANLESAIDGENYEVHEMYPAFEAVAELQEERSAVRSNQWAMEAEKVHAGMYEQARQAIKAGGDIGIGDVQICSVCGWTLEGSAPDKCPLCGAKAEKFVKF
ncbi:MAG: rubrerythrin family protein [Chloroflexi bacterium]|nr:rubrerythrin family protein [Chloroflexota bacterium]